MNTNIERLELARRWKQGQSGKIHVLKIVEAGFYYKRPGHPAAQFLSWGRARAQLGE